MIEALLLIFGALFLILVERRKSYQRGYDTGKADGIIEGWKNMPERDSRGRYKAKSEGGAMSITPRTDADAAKLEADPKFRAAWKAHIDGNSFYDLNAMSQPEVDAFRWAFLCGYAAQLAAKEQELAEAREGLRTWRAYAQQADHQLTARDATIEGLREELNEERAQCKKEIEQLAEAHTALKGLLAVVEEREKGIESGCQIDCIATAREVIEVLELWADLYKDDDDWPLMSRTKDVIEKLKTAQLPPPPSAVPVHPDTARLINQARSLFP